MIYSQSFVAIIERDYGHRQTQSPLGARGDPQLQPRGRSTAHEPIDAKPRHYANGAGVTGSAICAQQPQRAVNRWGKRCYEYAKSALAEFSSLQQELMQANDILKAISVFIARLPPATASSTKFSRNFAPTTHTSAFYCIPAITLRHWSGFLRAGRRSHSGQARCVKAGHSV